MNGKNTRLFFGNAIIAAFLITAMALAVHSAISEDIIQGTSPDQTTAKGYDRPNQYLAVSAQTIAGNMEPAIPHPDQEKSARQKLADPEKKTGKKPNILVFTQARKKV